MKIAVVLFFVLFLAAVLIAADAAEEKKGAGAGEAAAADPWWTMTPEEKKKKQEEACDTFCADKKEPALNRDCKETCVLNLQARAVILEGIKCGMDCERTSPGAKSCGEKCQKQMDAKDAEVTATCNEVCSKVEKEPAGVEKCKNACTPSVLLKEGKF